MHCYVATLARYVLVEAENEADALERGYAALYAQYEDIRRRFGSSTPVEIRTIRPATDDEIEHLRWHAEYVKKGKRTRVAARKTRTAGHAWQTDFHPPRVIGSINPSSCEMSLFARWQARTLVFHLLRRFIGIGVHACHCIGGRGRT